MKMLCVDGAMTLLTLVWVDVNKEGLMVQESLDHVKRPALKERAKSGTLTSALVGVHVPLICVCVYNIMYTAAHVFMHNSYTLTQSANVMDTVCV